MMPNHNNIRGNHMNFNKKILVAGMLLWNVAESMAQVESDDQGTVNHSAGRQIEEIIVQARRRDESLEEVPLAVTALSGDVLRQQAMVTTEDLLISRKYSLHLDV